jgi:membrane-bound metal-dependent hydrolase YbcI (DUF457 family)
MEETTNNFTLKTFLIPLILSGGVFRWRTPARLPVASQVAGNLYFTALHKGFSAAILHAVCWLLIAAVLLKFCIKENQYIWE